MRPTQWLPDLSCLPDPSEGDGHRTILASDRVRRVWAPWKRIWVVTYRITAPNVDDPTRDWNGYVTAIVHGNRLRMAASPELRDRAVKFAHPQACSWARWGRWPGPPIGGRWGTRCKLCRHRADEHTDERLPGLPFGCGRRPCGCGSYVRLLLTTARYDQLFAYLRGRRPWRWEVTLEDMGLTAARTWTGRSRTRLGMWWAWWRLRGALARVEGVAVWPKYPKGQ